MNIAIATTTRADWGLLSPLAKALRQRGDKVDILAGNMHFSEQLGSTFREIERDGFSLSLKCYPAENQAKTAAKCLAEYYDALCDMRPDCIICLGDRYEMLSIAQAAVMANVPVVHIAGGAVSQGATDDYFRNAITKLSWLHFTECEQYRQRVIQMGEQPERVINTGAIGIHNILSLSPIPQEELQADLDFNLDKDTLLCTMHVATREPMKAIDQYGCLLSALAQAMEKHKNLRVLFTYPNNDVDPRPLIALLENFEEQWKGRVRLIPSLGMRRYISALHYCRGVIGNSSSGIVEVPSLGIPVLDIGVRQLGRLHGPGVFHAACNSAEILSGIEYILSDRAREIAARCENPYTKPDTLSLMLAVLNNDNFKDANSKIFFDLPCDISI